MAVRLALGPSPGRLKPDHHYGAERQPRNREVVGRNSLATARLAGSDDAHAPAAAIIADLGDRADLPSEKPSF
jgi:hypothetical protein